MTSPPNFTDPGDTVVWQELGHLRTSPAVMVARAYIEQLDRRRAFWQSLANWLWPRGVAAGLCMSALAAAFLMIMMPPAAHLADVSTGVGERRTVTLEDGSHIMLDTDSAVVIRLDEQERHVDLRRGRANFEVAHDSNRPFRVSARGLTVTAIGTDFDVSAISEKTSVTLIRGRVAVEARTGAGQEDRAFLSPGQRLMLTARGQLTKPVRVDLATVTDWQEGRLDFTHETATEAIRRANRYSFRQIRLLDQGSGAKRIEGSFRTGDTDALAAALCALLDLKIVEKTDKMLVLDRVN